MREMDIPFVYFKVGEKDFTQIPPKNLQSFKYTKVTTDAANSFSITLYDDTALEVEEAIMTQGLDKVEFSYGWSSGDISPVYKGIILDYTLSFVNLGVQLVVSGTTTAIISSNSNSSIINYGNKKISDIVKEIAEREGWELGVIEETKEVDFYESNMATLQKQYIQQNISSVKFIKEALLPFAISAKTGLGGYQFYFSDEGDKVKINFHTPRFNNFPVINLVYTIGSKNSQVLSFSPNFSGVVQAMQGSGEIELTGVNPLNNDLVSMLYNKSSNGSNVDITGKYTFNSDIYKTVLDVSSGTMEELKALASSIWNKNNYQVYPASLTVLGDTSFEVQTVISILVLTKQGFPHHTSGIYLIQQIEDEISSSGFTTTLELIKNGTNIGSISNEGTLVGYNSSSLEVADEVAIEELRSKYNIEVSSSASSSDINNLNLVLSTEDKMTEKEYSVVVEAVKYLGIPYVYGGTTPSGFDCSGLVQYVFAKLGVNLPRVTDDQENVGVEISLSNIRVGDLVFWGSPAYHVGIYIGGGKYIQSPHTGDVVKISNLSDRTPSRIKRVL